MTAPPPITLLPGEQVIRHAEFTPRLILVYLKTSMILTNRRLVVSSPNTIFGFIPHGYSVQSAPLSAISDVACGNMRDTGLMARFALFVIPVLVLVVFAIVFFGTATRSGGF